MSELTLFHCPGSCSEGIVHLLDRLQIPHEVQTINLMKGEHKTPEFLAMNPKGKVPSLRRADGTVLTEFTAIAYWLARQNPGAGLLGQDIDQEARVLELLDFIVASIHMRGFTFVKVPAKFTQDAEGQEVLRAHGRAEVDKGLTHLSEILGDQDYMLGDYSIADAGAFYVLRWADELGILQQDNLRALFARLQSAG